MHRTIRAVLIVAAVLGATRPALAAPARLAVIVRGFGAGSDKAVSFVTHYVTSIFAQDNRYALVDVESTLGSPQASSAQDAFHMAQDQVDKGRKAFESFELDGAIQNLAEALTKYEQNAGYVTAMQPVAEILMMLGATHILRGEEHVGSRRLTQALTILPEIDPDPRVFNPAMRQTFEQAQRDISRRRKGSVALSSNPSYADVYVDGHFMGVTPAAIEGLLEGRHYVRVTKTGYRAWGKLVDVPGQVEVSELATLRPTAKYDSFDTQADAALKATAKAIADEEDSMPRAARDLAAMFSADKIVLADVTLEGERVRVVLTQYDTRKERRVKSASQVFSYDSRPATYEREIRDVIQTHFGPATLAQDTGDVHAQADAGNSHAWIAGKCAGMSCRKFRNVLLFGGGLGGVVLAGVGGILWAVAGQNNYNYRNNTVQTSPDAQSLRTTGTAESIVGDVLFFGGMLVAVGGVSMYLFWHPTTKLASGASSDGGVVLLPVPLSGGAGLAAAGRF